MKTSALSTNCVHRSVAWSALLFVSLLIACFGLLPNAHAVTPAPDGGYPGGNTAEGQTALQFLTSGVWNTAVGNGALFHDTTGNQNTAIGYQTLFNTTTGSVSVAIGSQTLFSNTTGSFNTANGFRALHSNTTGSNNTANGFEALVQNTTTNDNTAVGFKALYNNYAGLDNTANGSQALYTNFVGMFNTANGFQALYSNTGGNTNTATGYQALYSNTTSSENTAYGAQALYTNGGARPPFPAAGSNTAIGNRALYSNTLGSNNTALGDGAGTNLTDGDNNIDIGNQGVAGEANAIRIGIEGTQIATFISGISGATVTGTAVVVNGSGQLGVAPSSKRFKDEIKPMDKASETILALKPVTFRYKPEIDPKRAPQFGLVAEEVEKVNPDLVVRDKEGKPYSVRYDQVNAMLLNEFLKEHRKVVEQQAITAQVKSNAAKQEATIAELKAGMDALTATVKEQAAQIQKVSAQLEASNPASQVVANNH
ncbi:MAG: tail fiber domain-containing protein [Candidatus Udaeobacter sp.]